ncbi:hypothetical protein WT25_01760 [Burkholderia territorii]|nr:hypothetical protein WT25_01760 [Burkholderia territorii]
MLEVIGKGNEQRYVPISDACVDALRAHWRDRGEELDAATALKPPGLPMVIPPTPRAREKFGEPVASGEGGGDAATARGYSVRGARGLAMQPVPRRWRVRIRNRCANLRAASYALEAQLAHHPLDRAAGDLDPFALQLLRHLVGSVDFEVLFLDVLNSGRNSASRRTRLNCLTGSSSMNDTIISVGGRAPPARDTRTPY